MRRRSRPDSTSSSRNANSTTSSRAMSRIKKASQDAGALKDSRAGFASRSTAVPLPSHDELMARFAAACDLKQPIDRARIADRLLAWAATFTTESLRVHFVENAEGVFNAARDARDAWAAWA